MLKLIKYEFRKNLYGMCAMLGLLVGVQLYFMYAYFIADNRNKAMGAAGGLFLAAIICFFMVFSLGIMTYSKELSSKTSYLVFMTPNKAGKIIGSKLIYTLIDGILIAALLLVLGLVDMNLLLKLFDEEVSMLEMILDMLHTFGFNMVSIAYNITSSFISFLILFFMVVTLAYLSITLTATVLQNRKIKGLISIVLFIAVLIGVTKLGSLMPTLFEEPESMFQASIHYLPEMAFYLVIMIGSIIGTAQLLERKVSL